VTPWTVPAQRKLFKIHEYFARENRAAADRLIYHIYEAANYLEKFPQMGRPGLVVNIRELVVPGTPCVLRYRIRAGVARVIDIKHGKQQDFR